MSKTSSSAASRHFIAAYLDRMIHRAGLKKVEVAKALGYERSNVISMMTKGQMSIPLTKVPALADLLGIERRTLLHMVLREYNPDLLLVLCEVEGHSLSRNELEIVEAFRRATDHTDPDVTYARRRGVQEAFRDIFMAKARS
jgi:predicted XRE-type DNA-binding protein